MVRNSVVRRAGVAAILALSLLPVGFLPSPAQPLSVPPSRELMVGEELVYNVSYAFLDLGQIRIKTESRVEADGRLCYFSRAYIDSYKGVPLVDLHAVFESLMDPDVFSRRFMGKVKQDDWWDFNRYVFDYERNRVFIDSGQKDTLVSRRDTADVQTPYQDGLSLFFRARHDLFLGKAAVIPTMVKEKKVQTAINFGNTRESVEIDAVKYPVDVVEFDGTMEFVGIFGLTGEFEGWFSNDEARVPIKAKMRVLIGSVSVELMRWNRAGWIPPKGE
jgi:hypothetical protein